MNSPERMMASIDSPMLAPIVTRALGSPVHEILRWEVENLGAINAYPAHRRLLRLRGDAATSHDSVAWRVVLKIVARPPGASDDPSHPRFWAREWRILESDTLSSLPGLTPVRLLGVTELDDACHGLWLEELTDDFGGAWPLERYGLAARHLGELACVPAQALAVPGTWLFERNIAAGTMPDAPELLFDPRAWRDHRVRALLPGRVEARAHAQWHDQTRFRSAVGELPLVVGHNDAHAGNLFSRSSNGAEPGTVAVDWELFGTAPLSADPTYMVIATLRRGLIPVEKAEALEDVVLAGYLEGLERGGGPVTEAQVRLGYYAQAALRLGLIPLILDLALNERRRGRTETVWRTPIDELLRRWAGVAEFVLERTELARSLCRT